MADREMTNEEAIEILGGIRACYNIFDEYDEPKYAALSKAIFALKAEPVKHGRWIEREEWFDGEPAPRKVAGCSRCGHSMYSKHDTLNFCPLCGAILNESTVGQVKERSNSNGSEEVGEANKGE